MDSECSEMIDVVDLGRTSEARAKDAPIRKALLAALYLLVLLRPHFAFLPDVVSVYWPDLAILFMAVLCLLRPGSEGTTSFAELVCMLGLLLPISANLLTRGFSPDIVLAYLKISYYYVVFLAVYDLAASTPGIPALVDRVVSYSFAGNAAIAFAQLFAFPAVFDAVTMLFGDTKLRTIWTGYARVYGAFYNANWFGVYLVFHLAVLNEQRIGKRIGLLRYVLSVLLVGFLLAVSGSRTAALGALVATSLQYLRGAKPGNMLRMVAVLLPTMALLGAVVTRIEILNRTAKRFADMVGLGTPTGLSLQTLAGSRWYEWTNAFGYFSKSPWIGSAVEGFIPHNSFLAVLIRFGLIGSVALACLVLTLVKRLKAKHAKRGESHGYFGTASLGFLGSFLVMSLAGDYWFSSQVTLIPVLCYATALGYQARRMRT